MVGKVTIGGKVYKVHFGMLLYERFLEHFAAKKTATVQVTACIIYHGHENWCELNDESFELKKSEVFAFVEGVAETKDSPAMGEIELLTKQWSESTHIADLIKAGKEADKKKEALTEPPILEESHSESSGLSHLSTTA